MFLPYKNYFYYSRWLLWGGGHNHDFLMMGSQDEMVSAQLADKELLKQFREVELLSPEDKHLVKTFIDAFITKKHNQQLVK